ncbi:hypothetical protein ACFP9V_16730 [Deinococcus radiopugnans]
MSTPKRPSASLAVRALLVLGLSAAPALAQDTAPPAPSRRGNRPSPRSP